MVQLDLIELADLVRPEQLVQEILRQNPSIEFPIPVEELARLAGITKIEALQSEGFEGTLITNATKSQGAIFYSARSPRPRQRFTIGHELGHFLLPWHRKTNFQCTTQDIVAAKSEWEIEANRFAAELLMPASIVKDRQREWRDAELRHMLSLRDEAATSLEAAARRFVELSDIPCAIVFSKDNTVRYWVKSDSFPRGLRAKKGNPLPTKSAACQATSDPEDWSEISAFWWLGASSRDDDPEVIYEQTLVQEQGHKVTLLTLE
jgi:Zn-dependent peptidase ImmA (M78 family)